MTQPQPTLIIGDPKKPIATGPKDQVKEIVDLQVLKRLGVQVTETETTVEKQGR